MPESPDDSTIVIVDPLPLRTVGLMLRTARPPRWLLDRHLLFDNDEPQSLPCEINSFCGRRPDGEQERTPPVANWRKTLPTL
jgi:hypothetical protein